MVALLGFSLPLRAYEVLTHEDMSEAAAFSSVLAKPVTLEALGLTGTIEDPKLTFPNSKGSPRIIRDLIRDGANFEDDFPRSLNHFFNPLNGQGLSLGVVVGNPSPAWALEDKGEINGTLGYGKQEFSYRDARRFFLDALTVPARADRDKNFGMLFQTLGQVIHHVQDMAQPQHVRNDQHLELSSNYEMGICVVSPQLCADYLTIKTPSLYESYTRGKANLPFSGYAPVYSDSDRLTFTVPRRFWTTSEPRGDAGART